MPELPEVEIIRRGLAPAIQDKVVTDIIINRSDLRGGVPASLPDIIQGQRVNTIKRRGKYILAFTDSRAGFVLHLGMSGRLKIFQPGQFYAPQKHDHIVMRMADRTQVVFNDPRRFGMFYSVRADNWESQAPFATMGPEPLGDDFTGTVLLARLRGKKTPVKAALLDQRIVAGVGNIYACEALFESGIHPQRSAASIRKPESEKLAAAIRSVLERAIAAGGSSLRDYRQTNGDAGYFQHSFSVYDREASACPGCDCAVQKTGGIRRIVQSGRSSFFCPRKQQAGSRR